MECLTSTRRQSGFTLVTAIVTNPHENPARFRLSNALDGPVWPPRRRGYPEPGWDEHGYEGVLAAGETVPLGYAVPAEPVEPPARIEWTKPAPSGQPAAQPDPARGFADPRPPRGVLSPPNAGRSLSQSGDLP